MMMMVVSVSTGSLMICVSVAVLLVAKGFVRLPRPRMLSRGRLALGDKVPRVERVLASLRGEGVARTGCRCSQ